MVYGLRLEVSYFCSRMLHKQQQYSQIAKENISTQCYGFSLNLVCICPLWVLERVYINFELWQYFICIECITYTNYSLAGS